MINIYIINLQKRVDRWKTVTDNIKKHSKILNPIKSIAYEGTPGWLYCGLSHLRLIEFAKDMNLPYILVGEDDMEIISKDFDERFSKIIEYLEHDPDWDIFNGNPSYLSYHYDVNINFINNNPNIVRCDKGATANFIIYRSTIYDEMLELRKHYDNIMKKGVEYLKTLKNMYSVNYHAFDCQLQIHNFNIITSYPYLTTQRDDYSDIENTMTRYQEGIRVHGEIFIYGRINSNLGKKVIKLIDSNFSGDPCVTKYQVAKHILWRRVSPEHLYTDKDHVYFFTDHHLDINIRNDNVLKIAWLLEPPAIHPQIYEKIKEREDYFDVILTHDHKLSQRSNKYIWYPFGGTWIRKEESKIYDKTKLVSTIASNKCLTDGHKLRHVVINKYKKTHPIDVYGRAYKPILNKLECLKDYCFQIVIENSQLDTYFTEKIMDCFATGTIPIYWGTKNITNFFDGKGIITFNYEHELPDILESLSFEKYQSMLKHVQNNFNLVDNYRTAEDWLYINYPYIFDYNRYKDHVKTTTAYNKIVSLYKERRYTDLLIYVDYYLSLDIPNLEKKNDILFLKAHSLQELKLNEEAESAYMNLITRPQITDKLKKMACTNIQLLR